MSSQYKHGFRRLFKIQHTNTNSKTCATLTTGSVNCILCTT